MLNRRAFIATLAIAPAAAPFVLKNGGVMEVLPSRILDKRELDLERDPYSREMVDAAGYTRFMFVQLSKHLRDVNSFVVGSDPVKVGHSWDHRHCFTDQVTAVIPTIQHSGGKLVLERPALSQLAMDFAEKIRLVGINRYGRLEAYETVTFRHRMETKRLYLRFLAQWDVIEDNLTGRFDVIGARA